MFWSDYHKAGEEALSDGLLDDAQRLFMSAINEATNQPDEQLLVAQTTVPLSEILIRRGELAKAESMLSEAIKVFESSKEHNQLLANALDKMGTIHLRRREFAQALPLYARSVQLNEAMGRGEDSDYLLLLSNFATAHEETAGLAQAESLFRKVLQAKERLLGSTHPLLVTPIVNLAGCLSRRENFVDAEALHFRALDILNDRGCNKPESVPVIEGLLSVYQKHGRLDAALAMAKQLWQIEQKVLGRAHPRTKRRAQNVERMERMLSSPIAPISAGAAAENKSPIASDPEVKILENEVSIAAHAPTTIEGLATMKELLAVYEKTNFRKAKTLSKKIVDVTRKLFGDGHPETLRALRILAHNSLLTQTFGTARDTIRSVLKLENSVEGVTAGERIESLVTMSRIELHLGKYEAAKDWLFKAAELARSAAQEDRKKIANLAKEHERILQEAKICKDLMPIEELQREFDGTAQTKASSEENAAFHDVMARIMQEHSLHEAADEYESSAREIRGNAGNSASDAEDKN